MFNTDSIKKISTSFLDFVFPRFCFYCDTKMRINETFLCSHCFSTLKFASDIKINDEFTKHFADSDSIDGLYSLFLFEKDKQIQKLFHHLKYKEKFLVGKFLGKLMALYKADELKSLDIDMVLPVPLHRLKKAERGFNQSEYITKGFSENSGMCTNFMLLKRKRYTKSQAFLHSEERNANIRGAFSIKDEKLVKGKNIVVVDDIVTTGSTIKECGRILKEAGANKVFALTAAISN